MSKYVKQIGKKCESVVHVKMVLNMLIIPFIVSLVEIKVVTSENQRCYVCIPNIGSSVRDVTQLFPSGPSLPLCNAFQKDNKEYIRECPSPKYVGCLTQSNGTHITKTCSSIEVEDCKTANKIEYCYCKGHLCNSETVPVEEARPAVTPRSSRVDDDEDTELYAEGSGSSEKSSKERKMRPTLDDIGIKAPKPATIRPSLTSVDSKRGPKASSSVSNLKIHPYFLPFLIIYTFKNLNFKFTVI